MKYSLFVIVSAVIAAFIASVVTLNLRHPVHTIATKNAFDRVMQSGVLRCGYIPYPPEIIVDPTTHKVSGFDYEIIEALGQSAGLRIEWSEEVSTSTMFEGLHAGRYDAVCAALYEKPVQAKQAVFTTPIDYSATYIYTRVENKGVKGAIADLNRSNVTIAVVDGEISLIIAQQQFPRAKIFALPPTVSNPLEALTAVAAGKADLAFSQKATAEVFMSQNPGQVGLANAEPVSTYSQSLASFAPADIELKNFFDTGIRVLYANGAIPAILKKYDPQQQTYLPLRVPY